MESAAADTEEILDKVQEDETATAARKRVRSGRLACSGLDECCPDLTETEHLSKRPSLSDITHKDIDRVALLDAGAQYGKVAYTKKKRPKLMLTYDIDSAGD